MLDLRLDDQGSNPDYNEVIIPKNYDFKDNSGIGTAGEADVLTWEYLYDDNGNIIQDKNKGIDVTYNDLNLPTVVNFGS